MRDTPCRPDHQLVPDNTPAAVYKRVEVAWVEHDARQQQLQLPRRSAMRTWTARPSESAVRGRAGGERSAGGAVPYGCGEVRQEREGPENSADAHRVAAVS